MSSPAFSVGPRLTGLFSPGTEGMMIEAVIRLPTTPGSEVIVMTIKDRLCLLFLSIVPILSADQVVLKNGDTITGAIVKKDGAKLTIKSEFLGEVTMPWSAVKSLTSDEALTVVLPGGESVAGKISTSGDNLQ